jgi:hypothetical protein
LGVLFNKIYRFSESYLSGWRSWMVDLIFLYWNMNIIRSLNFLKTSLPYCPARQFILKNGRNRILNCDYGNSCSNFKWFARYKIVRQLHTSSTIQGNYGGINLSTQNTIFSVSSGMNSKSAVAIIRISGQNSMKVWTSIFVS